MPRVGLALGSNLGDRLSHIHHAVEELQKIATPGEPLHLAPCYQTEPQFCPPGSPEFLNTAIELHFEGSAFELLAITQRIEKKLGRLIPTQRNAPRVIDIDLLYFGDQIIESEHLILPHPRLTQRRFVLEPLAAIVPDHVLPGHPHSIASLLASLPSDEPALILHKPCLNQ